MGIREASPNIRRAIDRHPSLFNNVTLLEIQGAPAAEMNGLFEADETTRECVTTPPCVYAFSREKRNIFVRKVGTPWSLCFKRTELLRTIHSLSPIARMERIKHEWKMVYGCHSYI